ncbi:hypothetical protein GA0115240_15418 [Streptomyces sp. DvalAA-14]|uniref:hypothetical protein n=1 Tax=unclassified Streptomyces TaxID=2593676 RepID=UPI00081B3E3A|nr:MULTISPECIES: hypothetical protein [unclassified Streptomyces]SCE35565.1 hypothetical protein GA0115240_15418 [Streptomyces sp. DvalAA-14]
MTAQPYAVRFSPPAAKVLDTLPKHVEDTVWDVLDAAAGAVGLPAVERRRPEGEEVRYAAVNRPLRRLTVRNIVWLG